MYDDARRDGAGARAGGRAWRQAEWGTLPQLFGLAGSATAWARDLLEHLQIDTERMTANLRAAPTGSQPPPPGVNELIDRALAAHQRMIRDD